MSATIPCDYCHLPVRLTGAAPTSSSESVYCCFGCGFAARITQEKGERGHAVWMLTRLGVSAFLSMCVMICSIYLYGREVYEGDAAAALSTQFAVLFRYASLLLATPVLILLGRPILQNAWAQWRSRVVSTDALVVLGVAAAFVYSYIATLRESGATYFETACMILLLVTLGRWFEAMGRLRATEHVRSLEALIPLEARLVRDGVETQSRIETIQVGDILGVRAGERIGVDAVIRQGRANIDEQIVSGESRPIVRQAGEAVRAGTLNLDGDLLIQATSVGMETTLGRLIACLEASRRSKGRYERIADRVATVFLPVTVLLALVAAVLGFYRGGAGEAMMSAMSVLLIACPCGLGIATPMAVWVSLGRAASRGILLRTGEALEALPRVKTVYFDKTGTLTTGVTRVADHVVDANLSCEKEVSGIVHALASRSTHVISRGLAAFAGAQHAAPIDIGEVRTVAGRGLVASSDFGEIVLGNEAMMADSGLHCSDVIREALQRWTAAGRSVACMGWGGYVRGAFALDETIRGEARAAISGLGKRGCQVVILTGDHPVRGAVFARELDVETNAGLLPEEKVAKLMASQRAGAIVAMIGDGLNDAPAMAAADVGIAMGCGADVTRDAAAVCLLGNDLQQLPWLFDHARRTVRIIRLNLFWAYVYNAIGLGFAVSGRLSPVLAAAAMVASSLFVIGNSLRLNRDDAGHRAREPKSASSEPEVAF